eukprot:TRINITY_DN19113_c0_g1_i1.p1 TRINITY_DN19113_c0_g1~~TRINITY_DN19113_c0_g1_i1.p1  ORF type:complete len:316 (-),score=95.09 TRINITY_DN19113_c0_g1_i1:124-1071(-)
MFRNQYDTDVTTWSPAGRLHQVEYAMEAVKQGAAAVGLRSDSHVVLAALKRSASELSSFQQKLFHIDHHIGIAIAGLNADGRVLSRFMRGETLNHRFVYESPMPVGRLVQRVADKSQVCTQRSWLRPYGVGLLVAGCDATGPHLFQTCPSGNIFEFYAMAIGARSQAAKTYLERKFSTFPGASLPELIRHALLAVKESLAEGELTSKNCAVSIVGKGTNFEILEDDALQPYIDDMEVEEDAAGGDGAGEAEGGADTAEGPGVDPQPTASEGVEGEEEVGGGEEVVRQGGEGEGEGTNDGKGGESGGDGPTPMETS